MDYCESAQAFEPAAPAKKGGLFEAEVEARLQEEVKDCSEIDSGKAGTALILPLWFATGFHSALSSSLSQEDEYGALNFVSAWSLGYRSYTIQTLGLPPLSDIAAGSTVAHDHRRSASSTYAILKNIGELSEEILAKLPPVDVQKVAADLHVVPKFCEGLSVLYTPHKSSPCTCRAVEVIGEISREGVARPLSIKRDKKVVAASNAATEPAEKSFSVAERKTKVMT